MKRVAFILIVLSFVSCDKQKMMKQQLQSKKDKIEKLQEEVAGLEVKIKSDSTDEVFQIPIEVKEMEYENFNHYIEVSGNLEAVKHSLISPEMGGQIKEIHVSDGQRVHKGDLLVSLNTDVTEATIREIKTGLELADTLFQKQQRLYKEGIGSEVQFLQAKSNKDQLEARLAATMSQLRMSKIYAPFSGIVDETFQKKGELSSPGVPILQMVNLSKMRVVGDVSEKYLPAVEEGMKIDITFPTFPEIKITEPIKRTGKIINKANRTFQVEVEFNNVSEKLKPNMLGVLKINDYSLDSALVVPSIIIKKDIAKKGISDEFIFVAEKTDGTYKANKVYVKTGRSYDGKTIITKGLNPGQFVIVKGYNTVSTGAVVKF
jgi:RND family efflux transporter MFP subunit